MIHNWKRDEALRGFRCAPLTGGEWLGINCVGGCGAFVGDSKIRENPDLMKAADGMLQAALDILAWPTTGKNVST